ncbi:hypothetical protein RFI_02547 [Reticulomyxa filosa]|uniref:Uncharacterized protein n=1 Tax=Reticulomyxa filosa TaxID=46433 RepID=X6PA71_RETFI|nr:hypothetical protein RFI_02547 [Reticulomyxa filosa]|eukprot:ETO34547.1 hypothetical protein RFI_02547 [Reticulomyxa filosa]
MTAVENSVEISHDSEEMDVDLQKVILASHENMKPAEAPVEAPVEVAEIVQLEQMMAEQAEENSVKKSQENLEVIDEERVSKAEAVKKFEYDSAMAMDISDGEEVDEIKLMQIAKERTRQQSEMQANVNKTVNNPIGKKEEEKKEEPIVSKILTKCADHTCPISVELQAYCVLRMSGQILDGGSQGYFQVSLFVFRFTVF